MLKSGVAGPGIGLEGFGKPAGMFFTGVKGGLRHLQRCQDALGQEGSERLAADDFDDAAENVGGAAVIPFRPGLTDQRHAGE